MEIRTEDYEQLGKFYLGRGYESKTQKLEDDLVLYDSKDLVTHGVVLGMTGSGKTGLCIALLEEAAMDNIPAIVIDPKGDIGNLLLAFPDLAPNDFRPWINEDDALKKGITADEHAAKTATMWKEGLAEWGQSVDRIKSFRDKVDLTIYTPGSNAGLPVSIFSSLDVPEFEVIDDSEAFADRVESTVTSLLSLVGNSSDPLLDPEHILLSNIFSSSWRGGTGITLETLIRHVQVPPFDKIGVMDLDTVCPEKNRLALAMKLNNLLASPGFASWREGEALNIKRMLHTPEGKPRISIFSISHLSDAERMFFVSLLLNQMLGWMRSQTGTTSLRALLYMDEIYGYLPPSAMPPSKKPMMTMLKQARAFGLGVLLATQNPVDLDYKALSNIGTWWLGRLQTERDKARVLDGLEGAAASQNGSFDRNKMEQLLASLGNRIFLMNNVHEDAPVLFHVRWVMSYLAGPLGKRHVKQLMDPKRIVTQSAGASRVTDAPAPSATAAAPSAARPRLPRGADDAFLPIAPGVEGESIHYLPMVCRIGEVRYSDPKKGIDGASTTTLLNRLLSGGAVDWQKSEPLPEGHSTTQLEREPQAAASFGEIPQAMLESKFWADLGKEFVEELYARQSLTLWQSPGSGLLSLIGESEGDFRARLVHAAREARDAKVAELQEAFAKKFAAAEAQVMKARDALAEQEAQASSAKMDTAVRIGGTILGAVLGRSIRTGSRSSMTGASKAWKEGRDVARAEAAVSEREESLADLEQECEKAVDELKSALDPMTEKLTPVVLTPLKKNCSAQSVGILWMPYRGGASGPQVPAW
jgi:Helicase HerA, central domain